MRATHFAVAVGAGDFASGFAMRCGRDDDPHLRQAAHDLFVKMRDTATAEAIAAGGTDPEWRSGSRQTLLSLERHVAEGRHTDVLSSTSSPGAMSPAMANQRLSALMGTGRSDEALELLESNAHDLSPTAASVARFDLHWLRDEPDDALAALQAADEHLGASFDLVVRHRRYDASFGLEPQAAFAQLVQRATIADAPPAPDWYAASAFEYDQVDELLELGRSRQQIGRLGPTGRLAIARSLYVARDFEGAERVLRGLLGTHRHWDADKLHSRILLEQGHDAAALTERRQRGRMRPTFDEVEFFTLLHLGRHREAFSMYTDPADTLRLAHVFGPRDAADAAPTHDLFVIPQNGPGDEVIGSLLYASISTNSRLAAACDPRLESLFRRSFPTIDFVESTRRMGGGGRGLLAPTEARRAVNELFDLLNADAFERARAARTVVLGRSLYAMSGATPPRAAPLVVDPKLSPPLAAEGSTVGVMWRSEVAGAMRSIHYLSPAALAPLAQLDCTFLCLQSDATSDERRVLSESLMGRVQWIDDVDLRDDLDRAAATLATLTAAVGVGTTMIELSAAVGTTTVMLHPNRIGAWRARPGNHDYWHATMMTAVAASPQDPASCVDEAVRLLSERVGLRRA